MPPPGLRPRHRAGHPRGCDDRQTPQDTPLPRHPSRGGVYYLNDGLNHPPPYRVPDYDHNAHRLPNDQQAHHEIDEGNGKTVFLAVTQGNEAVGGSMHISDRQGSGTGTIRHSVAGAPNNSALSGFASQMGESLENDGITDHFQQLSALATLIQSIPYERQDQPD